MRRCQVLLSSVDLVKDFVRLVNQFPGQISIVSGPYVVDAKSIMGIFSLNLNEPVTVEMKDDVPVELMERLAPFSICENKLISHQTIIARYN